jgi:hypothetical protein
MKVDRFLSAIAPELGFTVSTVITIVKDAAHIKEHVKCEVDDDNNGKLRNY